MYFCNERTLNKKHSQLYSDVDILAAVAEMMCAIYEVDLSEAAEEADEECTISTEFFFLSSKMKEYSIFSKGKKAVYVQLEKNGNPLSISIDSSIILDCIQENNCLSSVSLYHLASWDYVEVMFTTKNNIKGSADFTWELDNPGLINYNL